MSGLLPLSANDNLGKHIIRIGELQNICRTARRLSSNFFPWGGKYKIEDLPTYEGIKAALARAGQVARATGQRLTAHPSEFVKLAAPRPELVEESLGDLELHGSVRTSDEARQCLLAVSVARVNKGAFLSPSTLRL